MRKEIRVKVVNDGCGNTYMSDLKTAAKWAALLGIENITVKVDKCRWNSIRSLEIISPAMTYAEEKALIEKALETDVTVNCLEDGNTPYRKVLEGGTFEITLN